MEGDLNALEPMEIQLQWNLYITGLQIKDTTMVQTVGHRTVKATPPECNH